MSVRHICVLCTVTTIACASALSAQTPTPSPDFERDINRWLDVEVWQGRFATRLVWNSDREGSLGRYDVRVDAATSGTVRFTRESGGRWIGSGEARYEYADSMDTGLLDRLSFGWTTRGNGETRVDEDSELWIDVSDTTYTLFIMPGGIEQEGIHVTERTHSSFGGETRVGSPADLDMSLGGFDARAPLIPLPAYGNRLCGSVSVWSTDWFEYVFDWDLWPAADTRPAGPCAGRHAEVPLPLDVGRAVEALSAVTTPPNLSGSRGQDSGGVLGADDEPKPYDLFFIALNDGGRSGQPAGCGDSVVPVRPGGGRGTADRQTGENLDRGAPPDSTADGTERNRVEQDGALELLGNLINALGDAAGAETVPEDEDLAEEALEHLLAITESTYGNTQLHNALARADLAIYDVYFDDGLVEIDLEGTAGTDVRCELARMRAQIAETILQFPSWSEVIIRIDGVPIEEIGGMR